MLSFWLQETDLAAYCLSVFVSRCRLEILNKCFYEWFEFHNHRFNSIPLTSLYRWQYSQSKRSSFLRISNQFSTLPSKSACSSTLGNSHGSLKRHLLSTFVLWVKRNDQLRSNAFCAAPVKHTWHSYDILNCETNMPSTSLPGSWHKLFHWDRVNEPFLLISSEAKRKAIDRWSLV